MYDAFLRAPLLDANVSFSSLNSVNRKPVRLAAWCGVLAAAVCWLGNDSAAAQSKLSTTAAIVISSSGDYHIRDHAQGHLSDCCGLYRNPARIGDGAGCSADPAVAALADAKEMGSESILVRCMPGGDRFGRRAGHRLRGWRRGRRHHYAAATHQVTSCATVTLTVN